MLKKLFLSGLNHSLAALTVLTLVPGNALAGYVPPSDARPPDARTSSSGGRSCGVSHNDQSLKLLAPQQHVGQTLTSHPTLVWSVPVDRPVVGELKIWELLETSEDAADGPATRPVLETPYIFTSHQGYMTFTLPADSDGLAEDKDYIWQVRLRCGNRPSDSVWARAQITVAGSDGRSLQPLKANPVERASQLAEAGFWYDAIALVSTLPEDESAAALRDALLEDLLTLEATPETLPALENDGIIHSRRF